MKKVIEYRLVHETLTPYFNKTINEYIKDGWEPYGSPFADGNFKCQGMVKYEEEKDGQNTEAPGKKKHPRRIIARKSFARVSAGRG